jgi:hypothetical protein
MGCDPREVVEEPVDPRDPAGGIDGGDVGADDGGPPSPVRTSQWYR